MPQKTNKKVVITAAFLILCIIVLFLYIFILQKKQPAVQPVEIHKEVVQATSTTSIIGKSVNGRNILAHTFGTGSKHITFVGGIHGGYEWNSVVLAYTLIDHLHTHPELIPSSLTVTIIPSLNPDAVYKVTGKEGNFTANDVTTNEEVLQSARFNANGVDLNRNFNCKWQPKSTWRSKSVSAGTSPFSEPEAQAFKNYITKNTPTAVIFWHSQSNAVYASQCEAGILEGTTNLMNIYAKASLYPAIPTFDAYAVTGAAEDWLASISIPAITVELKTHEAIEWDKNLAGSQAVINYYGK